MSTNCNVIQVLEPDPRRNLTIDADGNSLAVEEGGEVRLVEGVIEYSVAFVQAKLNALYDFIEADVASTDEDELAITPSMPAIARTTTGFRLELDGAPDSANYTFNWRVRVSEV